jgi:hypothetical protein
MKDKLYVLPFLFDFPISIIPSILSCCVLAFWVLSFGWFDFGYK